MAEKLLVGWREWLSLPDLGITKIKAKIDTGARTSCLHAFKVEEFKKDNQSWVKFWLHPIQQNTEFELVAEAQVIDIRKVTDSGGHTENRFVIKTTLNINNESFPIEVTLTNRENMMFRMLLGRTAMNDRIIVDPAASYLTQ